MFVRPTPHSSASLNFSYSLTWLDPLTGLVTDPHCLDTVSLLLILQPVTSSPVKLTGLSLQLQSDPSDPTQSSVVGLLSSNQSFTTSNITIVTPTSISWIPSSPIWSSSSNTWTFPITCSSGLSPDQTAVITITPVTIAQLVGQTVFSITESISGSPNSSYDSPPVFKYPRTLYVKEIYFTDFTSGNIITQVAPNQLFGVNWRSNRLKNDIGSCLLVWNDPSCPQTGIDVSNNLPNTQGIVTYLGPNGRGLSTVKNAIFTVTALDSETTIAGMTQRTLTLVYPVITNFVALDVNNKPINAANYGDTVKLSWTALADTCMLITDNGLQNVNANNNSYSYTMGLKLPILVPYYGTSPGIRCSLALNVYNPRITQLDLTPLNGRSNSLTITFDAVDIDSYAIDIIMYDQSGNGLTPVPVVSWTTFPAAGQSDNSVITPISPTISSALVTLSGKNMTNKIIAKQKQVYWVPKLLGGQTYSPNNGTQYVVWDYTGPVYNWTIIDCIHGTNLASGQGANNQLHQIPISASSSVYQVIATTTSFGLVDMISFGVSSGTGQNFIKNGS